VAAVFLEAEPRKCFASNPAGSLSVGTLAENNAAGKNRRPIDDGFAQPDCATKPRPVVAPYRRTLRRDHWSRL